MLLIGRRESLFAVHCSLKLGLRCLSLKLCVICMTAGARAGYWGGREGAG